MREGIESLNTDGDMRILKAARRYDTRYSPQDAVVLSSCACRASLLIVLTRPPPPRAPSGGLSHNRNSIPDLRQDTNVNLSQQRVHYTGIIRAATASPLLA